MIRQFEMVAYLCESNYGVVIGNGEKTESGSIFPIVRTGNFKNYLKSQILPILSGNEEKRIKMI